MKGTERWVEDTVYGDTMYGGDTAYQGKITDESLFVHRMHSGQGTEADASVAITPVDDDDEDRGKDRRGDR